jgi:hypothetical protein
VESCGVFQVTGQAIEAFRDDDVDPARDDRGFE